MEMSSDGEEDDMHVHNCGGEEGKMRGLMGEDGKINNHSDLHLSEYQNLEKTFRSMSDDRQSKCCPALFERAAASWWNPRFDSDILEGQYWRSTFPRTTRRFQLGLTYLLVLCLVWSLYFPLSASPHWYIFLTVSLALGCVVFSMFLFTCSPFYSENCFKVSIVLCCLLTFLSLAVFLQVPTSPSITETKEEDITISTNISGDASMETPSPLNTSLETPSPLNTSLETPSPPTLVDISQAGLFALYVEVLLLIYTVIPLPLYGTLLVGITYTAAFETLAATKLRDRDFTTVLVGLLLHICLHLIGCHILLMTQVRMRDTFMKVGQSLLVKRQLGMEKQLKEKMIHSVMPPKVSDWLMKGGIEDEEEDDIDSETGSMMRKISSPRSSNQGDIRTIFRPFNMNAMENVSILFADIVGFTRMSSNKSASQLVGLLNDLFGRFDRMCIRCQCEKISTLGDCYYCVSGCPEPRPEHAANCVEMGLSMIRAIKDFDSDCNESVNMRVGIHTGTVLCGIVGKKRFKFDVWSNDVNLANRMESTGKPGMVHISDKTYQFLKEDYHVQQTEEVEDMKTYFITGRKSTSVYHLKAEAQMIPVTVDHDPPVQASPHTVNNNKEQLSETTKSNGTKSLPVLGSEEAKEGRVIMNKLHRFLRQRSAPASGATPPAISLTRGSTEREEVSAGQEQQLDHQGDHHVDHGNLQGEEGSVVGQLRAPLLSKSEGSTPLREVVTPLPSPSLEDPVDSLTNRDTKYKTSPDPLPPWSALKNPSCPLVRLDSELDIVPGVRTPQQANGVPDPAVSPSSALMPMADINHVYCNTSNTSVNTNDIALTFQEIESVNCHGCGDGRHRALTQSLSRFHQLRKQSDLVLIRSVQEDTAHHRYFTRPPLHNVSCFFLDPSVETDYRRTAWKASTSLNSGYEPESTLASSSFIAFLDLLVSALVYLVVVLASLLQHGPTPAWVAVTSLSGMYQLLVLGVCVKHLVSPAPARTLFWRLYTWCRSWYPSQLLGALLLALPVICLLASMDCHDLQGDRDLFLNLLAVTLIHFCNFTQIYCYVKSLLSTLFALSLVLFHTLSTPCSPSPCLSSTCNTSHCPPSLLPNTSYTNSSGFQTPENICHNVHKYFIGELILIITMLIVLVWMLNREFEINYRLSYHCSLLAAKDRKKILNLKNQADWLLHNIIPNHVSDQLKKSAKYSENHKDVGIVFASLVNFNELYDESYMGGKEFLRVLNELISDFDELLDLSEFRNVEKIKTIGATFMAASGLNPFIREENQHKYQHLSELMEFAFSLERSVEDFNQSLIEFDLVLRIGLNYGDVTSGVIGTTKLYYDIWGDAVNIASRMDSTGVEGRIQVNERTRDVLNEWFEFEERGEIFVKGKDNMKVFLFTDKKESAVKTF